MYLLRLFGNRWWHLQTDWLSAAIYPNICLAHKMRGKTAFLAYEQAHLWVTRATGEKENDPVVRSLVERFIFSPRGFAARFRARLCSNVSLATVSIKYWNWPESLIYMYAIKLCDFIMDVIKWTLNFVWFIFGLKSCDFRPLNHMLRPRSIWKSYVWFQTKWPSTQFNYHYILLIQLKYLNI